jgi:hypothetical protein
MGEEHFSEKLLFLYGKNQQTHGRSNSKRGRGDAYQAFIRK